MASLKPEEAENPLWQGYALHTPTSASPHPPAFETSYPPGHLGITYHRQPQKGSFRSLDVPPAQSSPASGDLGGNGTLTSSPPPLASHHSYPSLKRPFQSTGDSLFRDAAPDLRDELQEPPRPSINNDHRLLAFSKRPDKHTIIGNHGRVHQIELSAQIHGMFFLSEMSTPLGEGQITQPELTCYRRNLFQISGTVTAPRGPLSVLTERGERAPIASIEVCVSASESVDGHAVKLIVIPWKTPPPKTPEIGHGQENEPTPIPLQQFDVSGPDGNADFSVYPIAYRRLQFRIATANNGRRRELQQHFTLHLDIVATLANGTKVNVCETCTAPIVVRGRSPRNFQARKEIPLVGSSSSRGGPPELNAVAGIGVGMVTMPAPAERPTGPKPQDCELQRSSFSFDASSLPPSSGVLRQSTYPPAYLPSHTPEHRTAQNAPSYQGSVSMDSYVEQANQGSQASSDLSHLSPPAGPQLPIRQQYAYDITSSPPQMTAPLRFLDNNPRPAKSPRHVPPPELPSSASYPDYGARFGNAYNGSTDPLPPRDTSYFPTSIALQTWTTTPDTTGIYGAPMPAPDYPSQHYQYSNESYPKTEGIPPSNYDWSTS